MIHVEVTYALPEKQRLIGLDVPEGTTMLEAARLSGSMSSLPTWNWTRRPWGCSARWWPTRPAMLKGR